MAGALVTFRPPLMYDAVWHIGLQPDDPNESVAIYNTTTLNAALAAMWPGGSFAFTRGSAGPLNCPISFGSHEFFFKGPILTTPRTVGGLFGSFAWEGLQSEDELSVNGDLGSCSARLTRIDGDGDSPVIRVRGGNFTLDGLTIKGRRHTAAASYTGTPAGSCVEIESRSSPRTNQTIIRNCCLAEAVSGIRTIAGYYNDLGDLVSDTGGAANGVVQNVLASGLQNVLLSENPGSRCWRFDTVDVQHSSVDETTVFNLSSGGGVTADNVRLQHNKVTLFRVNTYGRANSRLNCRDLLWENYTDNTDYLCLFKYDGPAVDGSSLKWQVRVSGLLDNDPLAPAYDADALIQISAAAEDFPVRDLLFDITNLPLDNFRLLGSGPWVYPQ